MFRRQPLSLGKAPSPTELTARMIGIGMVFAGPSESEPDIERTLVHASIAGMGGDLRTLSVLTTWLGVHHGHVHVERLIKLVMSTPDQRVRAYWAAVAYWLRKDRRFLRVAQVYRSRKPTDLVEVGTDFQLTRRGADERFEGSVLRVPAGVLRDRDSDVLTPTELLKVHHGYRNRVRMGTTTRADVWTLLEQGGPGMTASEIARRASCSFATAHEVLQDFTLLGAGASARP